MNKFKYLLLAASLFASSAVFTSCDDGDDDNTANPAEEVVKASKKHDTAILLHSVAHSRSLSRHTTLH